MGYEIAYKDIKDKPLEGLVHRRKRVFRENRRKETR
jgi:hypothetical protein